MAENSTQRAQSKNLLGDLSLGGSFRIRVSALERWDLEKEYSLERRSQTQKGVEELLPLNQVCKMQIYMKF